MALNEDSLRSPGAGTLHWLDLPPLESLWWKLCAATKFNVSLKILPNKVLTHKDGYTLNFLLLVYANIRGWWLALKRLLAATSTVMVLHLVEIVSLSVRSNVSECRGTLSNNTIQWNSSSVRVPGQGHILTKHLRQVHLCMC